MSINLSARVLDRLADAVERASWLDPIAEQYRKVTSVFRKVPFATDVLSGTFLGHPLHPLLVTVPIGSWSSALVLDLLGQTKAARALVGLGVLSAAPTAMTGASDWHDTAGAEQRVGLLHAALNAAGISCFAASYLARRQGHHVRGIVWTLPGMALIGAGGWLGGHLSYALGVGVDTTAFQSAETDWTDVGVDAATIAEGELSQVLIDGVAVLLSRADGEVVAYADRCTHRGGPLHEGSVVNGCVQCPWHEARFALKDGKVARGPATRPQPVYETRIDAGRVVLRRSDLPRTLRTNPVGA